jgi:hypothetical protein
MMTGCQLGGAWMKAVLAHFKVFRNMLEGTGEHHEIKAAPGPRIKHGTLSHGSRITNWSNVLFGRSKGTDRPACKVNTKTIQVVLNCFCFCAGKLITAWERNFLCGLRRWLRAFTRPRSLWDVRHKPWALPTTCFSAQERSLHIESLSIPHLKIALS